MTEEGDKAPLLVCRVAWMDRYDGWEVGMHSGARYVREKKRGEEVYNFSSRRGSRVYGFVRFPGTMHIERLGAAPDAGSICPVTVIWTAPRRTGGVFVVGWYRNATVHREMRTTPNARHRKAPGSRTRLCWWSISAAAEDVTLLEPDDRWFRIPPEFASQSLVAYLDGGTRKEGELRRRLSELVAGRAKAPAPSKRRTHDHLHDPERLVRIEKAAVNCVEHHFRSKGYNIRSVERERRGWDLEARRQGEVLHVEVKGCSGADVLAELTPNEYFHSHKLQKTYRICIVTAALTRATLSVFRWSDDLGAWVRGDGRRLTIEPKTGATLRCDV